MRGALGKELMLQPRALTLGLTLTLNSTDETGLP
jgi:hypothetical protein